LHSYGPDAHPCWALCNFHGQAARAQWVAALRRAQDMATALADTAAEAPAQQRGAAAEFDDDGGFALAAPTAAQWSAAGLGLDEVVAGEEAFVVLRNLATGALEDPRTGRAPYVRCPGHRRRV